MARHMGVLGSSGPGRARNDGVLGAMHDSTAARLSAMYGMGSPMATGPGMAYQDGSLGVTFGPADYLQGEIDSIKARQPAPVISALYRVAQTVNQPGNARRLERIMKVFSSGQQTREQRAKAAVLYRRDMEALTKRAAAAMLYGLAETSPAMMMRMGLTPIPTRARLTHYRQYAEKPSWLPR